jgi:hypothetical protein
VPKREPPTPWATTAAAKREAYPRRNVYFVGDDMQDVFDYFTWRAGVEGYETLDGLSARASAEVIGDILRRAYLRDMLDDRLAEGFRAWRKQEYEKAGIGSKNLGAQSAGSLGKNTAAMRHVVREDPRLAAFMRGRTPVSRSVRMAMWELQQGRCAICGKERPLKVYKRSSGASPKSEDDAAQLILICEPCRRKAPASFRKPSVGTTRSR